FTQLAKTNGKSCGVVFEFLNSQFRRPSAYVELAQMNKLLTQFKSNRDFYDLGFHIFEIGAAYTSQLCSKCGCINKESRKAEDYVCLSCGHTGHADLQASFNILTKWISQEKFQSIPCISKSEREFW